MKTAVRKAASALICSIAMIASTLPAHAATAHATVVSENPADTTPHLVYDAPSQTVFAFEQVGDTMFAGGKFNQVQDPTRTTTYARQNFVAFDAKTGVILPLDLSFDGTVTAIEAAPDGNSLFISGTFSRINGIIRRGIAKYDLENDRVDPIFAPKGMRTVADLKLVNDQYLIAAGNFSEHLMAMDLTTGDDLGTIDLDVAGVVDTTEETRIKHIAVDPNGTRLVATGNFATVNGIARKRAFMVNLDPVAGATLSSWYAPRFAVNCAASKWRISARGVDFSPDGSYFVVVSTGGPTGTNGICDAAARFETNNVSSDAQPTWINWTGGDTLWSVAVTGQAVYVGGHNRWLDNPEGQDSPGPGAVSRPGIGAIDPDTGMALSWNPTHSRNNGITVLFITEDGLWAGSDSTRFGAEDHAGIGFAPLDGSDSTRPATSIDVGPSGDVINTSATFEFSAEDPPNAAPSTFLCRLDGAAFEPCASPVTYDGLVMGPHTFQVFAVDGSYNSDATPAERSFDVVAEGTDLVGNPGFEVNLDGWRGDAASNTLTQDIAAARSGSYGVEVSKDSGGGSCGIDDSPNWVASSEDGAYTASIWARSHGDNPGATLHLRIREYLGGSRQATTAETLVLNDSWQQVTAAHTIQAPGSTLDFEAYIKNAGTGVCFWADDASITKDAPPPLDTTPPETFIDSGPSGSVPDSSATFTFSASEPATFQCSLDGVPFSACASPATFDSLAPGSHSFQVAATDAIGNTDPTPAVQDWSVFDPDGELVGNPGFEVNLDGWRGDAASNTLTQDIAAARSGSYGVEVSKDSGGGSCGIDDSPNWVASSEDGAYTASIWARSHGDNPGATLHLRIREYLGGSRQATTAETLVLNDSWQQVTAAHTIQAPGSTLDFEAYIKNAGTGVCFWADDASIQLDSGPPPGDTTPPETFIDSGPSGTVPETSATFTFSASEPATFECSIADPAAFSPCISPVTYDDLVPGLHHFEVRATDWSNNVDLTPAIRSWTVGEGGTPPDPGELIGNPGFEASLSGWRGDASSNTLTMVGVGRSGNYAVEISKDVANGSCGIDDSPNWVAGTEAGIYTASIWARSDAPDISLKLRVREYVNGARQGTTTETLVLSDSWQQVTVVYTVQTPGSTLDFEAHSTNAPAGVCFQADDASLTHVTV